METRLALLADGRGVVHRGDIEESHLVVVVEPPVELGGSQGERRHRDAVEDPLVRIGYLPGQVHPHQAVGEHFRVDAEVHRGIPRPAPTPRYWGWCRCRSAAWPRSVTNFSAWPAMARSTSSAGGSSRAKGCPVGFDEDVDSRPREWCCRIRGGRLLVRGRLGLTSMIRSRSGSRPAREQLGPGGPVDAARG